MSELEIEGIKRKVAETQNEEAQEQNTEKEPVGSENIKLVQDRTMTEELDEKEEVREQSEEQNIWKKLKRELRRTKTKKNMWS